MACHSMFIWTSPGKPKSSYRKVFELLLFTDLSCTKSGKRGNVADNIRNHLPACLDPGVMGSCFSGSFFSVLASVSGNVFSSSIPGGRVAIRSSVYYFYQFIDSELEFRVFFSDSSFKKPRSNFDCPPLDHVPKIEPIKVAEWWNTQIGQAGYVCVLFCWRCWSCLLG